MGKYQAVLEILEGNNGTDLAQTMLDSIPLYGRALAADGCITDRDSENLYNIVWLLKAILKDCCGVDVA